MPWDAYRRLMLGELSPWAACAASPRNPGGAYDAAPRWLGRDQEEPQTGRRGLSGAYVRATSKFLADAGVEPQDIDAVVEILAQYATNDEENGETADQRRGLMPHLAGAADAARSRLAYDAYGNLRPRPRPMSERQKADFEKRFPGVSRIGVA